MKTGSVVSLARLLERIEILRSGLRWAPQLDRGGVQKILRQVNKLREDVLLLSGVERYKKSMTEKAPPKLKAAKKRLQALMDRNFVFEGVFGENPRLLEALETVERAARTELPILIEGESGTGKELLAKLIHAGSDRSEKPFVSVNCGAITPTLLESDLFGHVKGAFTGSVKDRKGKFETAKNGIIFLDEIGELSAESQVKLLRVLESGEIQRVGSDEVIRVNTRILAATNRNLYQMTGDGQFREDLYYRLSVISVTLPPLRERTDEIPLLIDYFCAEASEKLNRPAVRLSPRLRRFLQKHPFPGNIRELRNIIYRVACLADEVADLQDLPETIRPSSVGPKDTVEGRVPSQFTTLAQARKAATDVAEKEFLEEHLTQTRGNVTQLAKRLDMNRSYLQTLLKNHGMRAKDFKAKPKSAKGS
ncbi:MAG: sigma-54 dependent transcriptional regulator [Thermodesulfobacteriota bacterium]|nr:sigma-54 dependent transcriptional regulator [Thermodesulfobacteriota bacterium]